MPTLNVAARQPDRYIPQAAACLLAAGFLAFHIWYSWIGLIQSDDQQYALNAQAWLQHGPVLATTHWGLRHGIVLPMAALFGIFGVSEATLTLTATIFTLLLIGLACLSALRAAGVWAAVFTALLLAAIPEIAGSASLMYSDVPECVFILGSVICFDRALDGHRIGLLILSGILAGLAAITRETTICLLFFYGVLFVRGHGGNRRAYLWIGLGFLVVTGLDTLLLWWGSGDPLYRLHTTLRGVANDNPEIEGRMAATDGLTPAGQFAVPRLTGSLLMMLLNQSIGPVLWAAIPAAVLVAAIPSRGTALRLPRLLGLLALIWFVGLSWVFLSLFLIPRYQTVSVVALTVSLGVCLTWAIQRRRIWRWATVCILAGVCVSGVLLTGVSDRRFMFSERQLVQIAETRPDVVHTDPATFEGAEWLLAADGNMARVLPTPPGPGDYYVYSARPRRALPAAWPIQAPPPEWREIARYTEPARGLLAWLDQIGLLNRLPGMVRRKLTPPPRVTVLYQVPG